MVGVLALAALGVGAFLVVRDTTQAAAPVDLRPVEGTALDFAVPPDWQPAPDAEPTLILGVPLDGVTYGPAYECGGDQYWRGLAASAFVPGEQPPEAVAAALAQETGVGYYTLADGTAPEVQVGPPGPIEVTGTEGVLVEATSRAADPDGCLAAVGTVFVLAVPTTGPDGQPGTAVLLVNGDVEGGPPTAPPSPDRATLEAMVASARLPTI